MSFTSASLYRRDAKLSLKELPPLTVFPFSLNDILKLISLASCVVKTRPRGYKTFFMLHSAEHKIFSANKYENANNRWHFHIY